MKCLSTASHPAFSTPILRARLIRRQSDTHSFRRLQNKLPRIGGSKEKTAAMASGGVANYAKWSLAMVTSIPIWVGGAAATLFLFLKK